MTSDLVARDARSLWHPYTQHGVDPEPLPVASARGAWLTLTDGRRILDAIGSWWTCLHGHGHPRIVRAIAEQAERLDHVLFAGCTHAPAVELAERLLALAPPGLARVFYSDDGSTAVEVALKAAYLHWVRRGQPERTTFVALEGGYHGDTFGSMAAGDPDPFFADLAPFLFRVERVPPSLEGASDLLERLSGRVAALVIEPLVQGAAGMRIQPDRTVREARALADRHGLLLVADEVLTGFGRTGEVFACGRAGVAPDLLCLAKGLTGGALPLAATLATEAVYASFLAPDRRKAFFHGHSYTANPIGCAAALASLDLLEAEDTPGRLDAIGRAIEDDLRPLAGVPGVKEVRRIGGIVAVELESDSGAGYLSDLGPRLRIASRKGDVLLRPLGNVLYAVPPSCTTREECGSIAGAIDAACRMALRDPGPRTAPPTPEDG